MGGEGFAIVASLVKRMPTVSVGCLVLRPTGQTDNLLAAQCANIWPR